MGFYLGMLAHRESRYGSLDYFDWGHFEYMLNLRQGFSSFSIYSLSATILCSFALHKYTPEENTGDLSTFLLSTDCRSFTVPFGDRQMSVIGTAATSGVTSAQNKDWCKEEQHTLHSLLEPAQPTTELPPFMEEI